MSQTIAIIGAGYVGVPLGRVFADAGHSVVLVDVQADRVEQLNRGESYIEDVPSEVLKRHVDEGRLTATTDYDELREADAILVALPTPLSAQREPDLDILLGAVREIAPRLREGHLVVARIDHVPGHDARGSRPDPRAERPEGGQGLPPGVLARARRPRPRGLDDEDDARRSSAA